MMVYVLSTSSVPDPVLDGVLVVCMCVHTHVCPYVSVCLYE